MVLNGILIIFNRDFFAKDTFVNSILTHMEAHGRPYKDWMGPATQLKVLVDRDAQEPMKFLACAFWNFGMLGISISDGELEHARFEGSAGVSGTVVTHWRVDATSAEDSAVTSSTGTDAGSRKNTARARERAREWWRSTDLVIAACDKCNARLREGEGCLSVPVVGVSSNSPDLLCVSCYDKLVLARPYEGRIQHSAAAGPRPIDPAPCVDAPARGAIRRRPTAASARRSRRNRPAGRIGSAMKSAGPVIDTERFRRWQRKGPALTVQRIVVVLVVLAGLLAIVVSSR